MSMSLSHLALALTFAALAAAMFARAKRTSDGKVERSSRFAGTLLSVASIAFLVAASLAFLTGSGR